MPRGRPGRPTAGRSCSPPAPAAGCRPRSAARTRLGRPCGPEEIERRSESMKRLTSLAAIALVLSLSAGCAHRLAANELPPEPPSATATAEAGEGQVQDNGIAPAALPGSRADFLQTVPSDRVFFGFAFFSLYDQDRAALDAPAGAVAPRAPRRRGAPATPACASQAKPMPTSAPPANITPRSAPAVPMPRAT